jgi:hypothetical protein
MMKRLAIFGLACSLVIVIAACGGSTAPKDTFSGIWSGTTSGLTITTTTSQTGSAITGSCTAVGNSVNLTCTLTGTSSPPSLTLTMAFSDAELVTFAASYATRDSVAGTLAENDTVFTTFSFKKQ